MLRADAKITHSAPYFFARHEMPRMRDEDMRDTHATVAPRECGAHSLSAAEKEERRYLSTERVYERASSVAAHYAFITFAAACCRRTRHFVCFTHTIR